MPLFEVFFVPLHVIRKNKINFYGKKSIIYQSGDRIRYTLSFVSYKEKKEFAKDLKEIYTSPNEETGYSALQELKEKWDKKYPYALRSWENNWS